MAQNENQVDVSIKLGADISGGVQTEKELERIRSKTKETERTAKNVDGFKKLRQGAEDVRLCHIIYFERKRLTAHARRKIQNKKSRRDHSGTGARGGTRTRKDLSTCTSSMRVCQFHHPSRVRNWCVVYHNFRRCARGQMRLSIETGTLP